MKRETSINTREEARTSDVVAAAPQVSMYTFPELGVTVEADNYKEALEKAKEAYKKNKS